MAAPIGVAKSGLLFRANKYNAWKRDQNREAHTHYLDFSNTSKVVVDHCLCFNLTMCQGSLDYSPDKIILRSPVDRFVPVSDRFDNTSVKTVESKRIPLRAPSHWDSSSDEEEDYAPQSPLNTHRAVPQFEDPHIVVSKDEMRAVTRSLLIFLLFCLFSCSYLYCCPLQALQTRLSQKTANVPFCASSIAFVSHCQCFHFS
jgi:hypothetical protein